ncbi:MAG: hypothetical protein IBX55_00485 [Methyloprofundus sp.]|nr:hypothetical protein [Methyloprofundus sp.]
MAGLTSQIEMEVRHLGKGRRFMLDGRMGTVVGASPGLNIQVFFDGVPRRDDAGFCNDSFVSPITKVLVEELEITPSRSYSDEDIETLEKRLSDLS